MRGELRPHDGESGDTHHRNAKIDQPSEHAKGENSSFVLGVLSPRCNHVRLASKTEVNRGLQLAAAFVVTATCHEIVANSN
jgi:hypothetical protein